MKRKIIEPVAPSDFDILLTYVCPECHTPLMIREPILPIKIQCPQCELEYPILPAEATSLQYLKLIFANGGAIINSDFV